MISKDISTILAFLLTASSLTLCNIAVPAYSFPHQATQSQADPENKQILKAVDIVLKGVNTILMGKTAEGLDQLSIGVNMIRSVCNIANSATNGTGGNGTNGEQGSEGGNGAHSCGSAINGGIGGSGGNGGIGGNGGHGSPGTNANGSPGTNASGTNGNG